MNAPEEDLDPDACALCQRRDAPLTKHHLIPRSCHNNARLRGGLSKAEAAQAIIPLCRACHSTVHAEIGEKQLARHYHTLTSLQAHPAIAQFAAWVATRPGDTRIPVRPRKR